MVYLTDVRARILESASDRDRCLYSFLNGLDYSYEPSVSDLEDILVAKAMIGGSAHDELVRLRKMKPVKGFYYSNNLVLLIAASLIDKEGEISNLESYLSRHGFREQLIINIALGTKFRIAENANSPLDRLAKQIMEDEVIGEGSIRTCMSSVKDVYDLCVVEAAIAKALLQFESKYDVAGLKDRIDAQNSALNRVEFIYYFLIFCFVSFLVWYFVPPIIDGIVNDWDRLEPYAYVVDKLGALIILLGGIVVTIKINTIRRYVKLYSLRFLYWCLGTNYSRLGRWDG